MPINVSELTSKEQTGEEMYRLVDDFSGDIKDYYISGGRSLADISLPEYYNIIKNIPFREDKKGVEVVTRPLHLFSAPWRGWDCKKKGIAIASWLKENHVPWKFTAVSRKPDGRIHHVIVKAEWNGKWLPIDATYSDNELYQTEKWTNEVDLPDAEAEIMGTSPKLVSMYGCDKSINSINEFNGYLKRIKPEYMGEIGTIVSAIVGTVGAITAGIIGAVSRKRSDERQMQHSVNMANLQRESWAEAAQEEAQGRTAAMYQSQGQLEKILIPAALFGGLFLVLRS